MLKARLKQLEAQVAKDKKEAQAKVAQAKNVNNGVQSAASSANAPPPVFVDLRKGLFVELKFF